MSGNVIPVDARRKDWPRLVANKTNSLETRLATVEAGGGIGGGHTLVSVSASYTETATSGEKIVLVTASGQTVTLPTAGANDAILTFKLMVAGNLTLDGAGAETIDGGLTAVLLSRYEAVTLVSNGSNWVVV